MVRITTADMADLADARPDAYRLENAHACLAPAEHVLEATRAAVGDDRHDSTHQAMRDALPESLAGIDGLRASKPEGGYFFRANISGLRVQSPDFCRRLLEETGVALTPMVAWGADDFGLDHVHFIFTDEPEERLREAGALVAAFAQGIRS